MAHRVELEDIIDTLADAIAERVAAKIVEKPAAPTPPQAEGDDGSPAWLTTRTAAKHLGVSKAALELWRKKGSGPQFARLGRSVRYARADLDKFARNGHPSSES